MILNYSVLGHLDLPHKLKLGKKIFFSHSETQLFLFFNCRDVKCGSRFDMVMLCRDDVTARRQEPGGARGAHGVLRQSCDGVAAVTEQRRPAPSRSFCASRLDATR